MAKRNKVKRISFSIAISILTAIMLCSSVYAAPIDKTISDLPEILELRQANAKAYRLNDHEIQFEIFASDIHYIDNNGVYQEIDNSIVNSNRPDYKYRNNKNAYTVYFGDDKILLDDGRYPISFELQNAFSRSKLIRSNENRALSNYDKMIAEDDRAVIYKDILSEVDIAYTARDKVLKEDIILRSYTGISEFTFKINSIDLTPILKDGCIVFVDGADEIVSSLGKLFMYDANGKYSEDVSYSIAKIDGSYYVTLTADKEFLQSSTTIYPVVIDPTYEFQWLVNDGYTYDTFTSNKYPNTNYGDETFLAISTLSSYTYGVTNAYVRFSSVAATLVPYDFPIKAAYLELTPQNQSIGASTFYLNVSSVESSWSETILTWNNNNVQKGPFSLSCIIGSAATKHQMNVSEIVQRWNHIGYTSCWGFEIQIQASEGNPANIWAEYYSCEYSNKTKGPKLTIVAEDTSGFGYEYLGSPGPVIRLLTPTVTYYDALGSSTYTSDLQRAMDSWNRTNIKSNTGVNVSRTTITNNDRVVQVNNNIGSGILGQNNIWANSATGIIGTSIIEINATNSSLNDDTAYRNSIHRQAVFTHELAHSFGLVDHDTSAWKKLFPDYRWTLMSYASDFKIVVVPSRRDIMDVRVHYP